MNHNPPARSGLPLLIWSAYVLFVIYGSLVPLDYKPIPLDQAWLSFQNIPFLALDVQGRADWFANGVLYIPVGFLTTYLLTHTFHRVPVSLWMLVAIVFSVALALAVEFTQLFFPPRTVSLNDIYAECVGTLLGVAFAATSTGWFHRLLTSFFQDGNRLKVLVLDAYVLAYLAFALFPFDVLLSWGELSDKFASNSWGWLLAGDITRPVLSVIKLATEVVLSMPFGILMARLAGAGFAKLKWAALIGLLLGVSIEVAQFFIASGVSQGLSIVAKTIGVCAGLALGVYGKRWTFDQIAGVLRRLAPAIAIGYGVGLLEVNGWLTHNWHDKEVAAEQLSQVSFIPFFYHYFTTEAIALFSLGAVSLSYTPVGLLAWAYRRSPGFALVVAALIAACIEAGKLFIQGSHPDPTNVLLAGAAGWFTVYLMRQLARNVSADPQPAEALRTSNAQGLQRDPVWLWVYVWLVAATIWVVRFPSFPWLVAAVLVASGALVWYRPLLAFAIIPAALPVFDLAPWSGRFFLDEFDALLLVVLAIAYRRAPVPERKHQRADLSLLLVSVLLLLNFCVSAVLGLWPFKLPDLNAFSSYYSPYNAIRLVKGAMWAALVYLLSRKFVAVGDEPRRPFCWGMAIGLALTVAVVVWERNTFSTLWDFSDGYRVTGPVSAAHTGGAYVDSYLAAALPFLIVLLLQTRSWLVRLMGLLVILPATYALMVTFSRGAFVALVVAILILLLATVVKKGRLKNGMARSDVVLAALVFAMALTAAPIYNGEFVQSRISSLGADFEFRKARLIEALRMRDPGLPTELFGMGLGRFPETVYWRGELDARAGNYRLLSEAGNTFVRLDFGDVIGVEQLVHLAPQHNYLLKLDVRPSKPGTTITVPICEKWLLTSDTCVTPKIDLGQDFGKWRSVEARFDSGVFSERPWYSKRTIKLALTHLGPQSTIDFDNVQLIAEDGTNLLRNGDFSKSLDHWFFSTSGALHAHWRVHNLVLAVLFDQGWFGLVAVVSFLALALVRGAKKAWMGDAMAAASLAALCGFLAGGLFDNPIDSPRFLLLMLLLAWACFQPATNHAQANGRRA